MTATPDGRRDLAAMVVPLARELIAAEEPVLAAHHISMWGYIVLSALVGQPVRVLDELQEAGLIQRRPDPADRRVHLLSLTPAGRERRQSVQAGIRRSEEGLLAQLPAADREAFVRSLQVLDELYRARLAE
jgi:DNA-binding PadR family transcriptional regulator